MVFWYEIRKFSFWIFIVLWHSIGCIMYDRGLRYHQYKFNVNGVKVFLNRANFIKKVEKK